MTVQRVLLVLLLGFVGLFTGTLVGSAFFVPAGSGLAGPATALGYGAVGGALALVVGGLWAAKASAGALSRALLVTGAVAAAATAWIAWRVVTIREASGAVHSGDAMPLRQQATAERPDLLTFAHGAVPVRVGGSGAALGVSFDAALRAVDGNAAALSLNPRPGSADTDFEFVYALPAPTVFDRFAVPNVIETPSPSTTFVKTVEIFGSSTGDDTGFERLASGTLATHRERGEVSLLTVHARPSVRWVRVRLSGAVQPQAAQLFLQFSEIVGNGTQEAAPMARGFTGVWAARGTSVELRQDGPVVTGCYDRGGELTGTVAGSILRATGTAQANRVPSVFILSVAPGGELRGVRSTNGAPFALVAGDAPSGGAVPTCPKPPATALACGAVIHGITFDYDSAVLRPESEALLARLHDGLRSDASATIVIEGHTSSEGEAGYNLQLSQRRAQSVVQDLVRRGIAAARLQARGIGEVRPIASNDDENGRSMNRRVEVHCQ